MTDTTTLAPTDAEIEELLKSCGMRWAERSFWQLEDADLHPAIRATLAKWGAPAPASGETETCKCCGEGSARIVVTRGCDTCTSVYAGMSEYAIAKNARAPLSAPQIAAMYLEAMGQQHMFSTVEGAVTRFTRAVEKHHGITAAQKETPNVP